MPDEPKWEPPRKITYINSEDWTEEDEIRAREQQKINDRTQVAEFIIGAIAVLAFFRLLNAWFVQ